MQLSINPISRELHYKNNSTPTMRMQLNGLSEYMFPSQKYEAVIAVIDLNYVQCLL